jgi:type VI protein secretion system component VasA
LPGEIFSTAAASEGLSEQPRDTVLVQVPENNSTIGSNIPKGATITESPVPEATKENHTSGAELDVAPLQFTGARLCVAPALEYRGPPQVVDGRIKIAEEQLSFAGGRGGDDARFTHMEN